MTYRWRRPERPGGVWHLMHPERPKAYCGRDPHGAWKETNSKPYPWPDRSCFSCMDVWAGNFPYPKVTMP